MAYARMYVACPQPTRCGVREHEVDSRVAKKCASSYALSKGNGSGSTDHLHPGRTRPNPTVGRHQRIVQEMSPSLARRYTNNIDVPLAIREDNDRYRKGELSFKMMDGDLFRKIDWNYDEASNTVTLGDYPEVDRAIRGTGWEKRVVRLLKAEFPGAKVKVGTVLPTDDQVKVWSRLHDSGDVEWAAQDRPTKTEALGDSNSSTNYHPLMWPIVRLRARIAGWSMDARRRSHNR